MLDIIYSSFFKKDFKKIRKLPIDDLKLIFSIISTLENNQKLDKKYKAHDLIGN